jgi:hypothetical protein
MTEARNPSMTKQILKSPENTLSDTTIFDYPSLTLIDLFSMLDPTPTDDMEVFASEP